MRVLITGASGQLGAYLLQHYAGRGVSTVAWSGSSTGDLCGVALEPVDLENTVDIEQHLDRARPELIIHSAAVSGVGDAYQNPARARAINTTATARLAQLAADRDCRIVYISTDMVFDGEQGNFKEPDEANPLSVYGKSKLDAEPAVLALSSGLVIRVSLLYGTSLIGRPTFVQQLLRAIGKGETFRLFDDEWRTPLDLETAARSIAIAAESDAVGLLHLGGRTKLSRHEMGLQIVAAAGMSTDAIEVGSRLSIGGAEPRPKDLSLDSRLFEQKFHQVERPTFEESLSRYL